MSFLFVFLFQFAIPMHLHGYSFNTYNGIIKGQITDAESGEPIDYARIHIIDLHLTNYSDKDGFFELKNIPLGKHTIQFFRLGYRNLELDITIAEEEIKEIKVQLLPRPISSETVIVNAARDDNSGISGSATYSMSGEKLRQSLGSTIAKTVDGEPGMSQRSMGPAPARPVLRGLGGDRLLILEDGARTGDLSATSNDHAVVLDPLNADQIEIYRGPEALQFGANTIAGVINVWNRNIATTIPEKARFVSTLQTESVNAALAGGLGITLPLNDFALQLNGTYRTASDISTPGGVLKNTGIDTYRFNSGLSLIKSWGYIGVSGSLFDSGYGIPGGFIGAHPNGVSIDVQRKQYELKSSFLINSSWVHHIDFNANLTQYNHQEYESNGSLGVEFGVVTYSANLIAHTSETSFGTSTWGLWSQIRDYANGGFVFTPNTTEREFAGYWYNEKALGKLRIETALRYDFKDVLPAETGTSSVVGVIQNRSFNSWSGALELGYSLTQEIELGARTMRTFRAPGLEELFSQGPHLAAYSYEIGSADNDIEIGFNAELFAHWASDSWHAEIAIYRNRIYNYLYPKDIDSLNLSQLLPVFRFSGQDAVFYGSELHVEHDWNSNFSSSGTASYTWAQLIDDNQPVPFIPPFSGKIKSTYKLNAFHFTLHLRYAASQLRTGQFEQSTDGFVVLGGGVEYIKSGLGGLHMVSLQIENATNATYRNHLSRVKSVMPEPGINISLLYRVYI